MKQVKKSGKTKQLKSKSQPVIARVDIAQGTLILKKRGLYFNDGNSSRRISDYVEPVADTVEPGMPQLGLKLRFQTKLGEMQSIYVKRSEVMRKNELITALVDMGFAFPPERKDGSLIAEFISRVQCKKLIHRLNSSGWHTLRHPDKTTSTHFLIGSEVIGPAIENVGIESQCTDDGPFGTAGDAKGWASNIGRLCRGNPTVMFAVCHGLSAPLLELKNAELDGVNFSGTSSKGKSTVGEFIVASLFGTPRKYALKWWMTANSIEGNCALYNDMPLVIDEIGQASPQEIGEVIYHAAGGVGKQRLSKHGNFKPPLRFRNKLVSTGEESVAQRMLHAGKTPMVGQEIRMVNIPVEGALGIFAKLHGYDSAQVFADALQNNALKYHGVVGREFVRYIARHRTKVQQWLEERLPTYRSYLETAVAAFESTDAERRVVNRWALTVFAGELATFLKLTNWKVGEAKAAVAEVLKVWLKSRRELPVKQRQQIIVKIGTALASGKYLPLNKADGRLAQQYFGYQRKNDGEKTFLISKDHFHRLICQDIPPTVCVHALRDAGFLIATKERGTKQVRVHGLKNKPTFYEIRQSINRA